MPLETSDKNMEQDDPFLPQPRNNNREAFGQLFPLYRARLYNVALRLMGDPDDAEDALQDGLLSACRNASTFEGRSQLSTWLTRIVVNAALMRMRRRRRVVMTSIDQDFDQDNLSLAARISDTRPDPEAVYAREEQRRILEDTLQSLPPLYRQALWLCDIEEMNTKEAAEVLGVTTENLKTRLSRARARLRNEFIKPKTDARVIGRVQTVPAADHRR